MNLKPSRPSSRGLTTLDVVIVVLIIGGIVAIALPNFLKGRTSHSADSCLSNMMWVERAKEQWAEEKKQPAGATPTPADLMPYLQKITPIWNNKAGWQKPPTTLGEVTNLMFQCPYSGTHKPRTVGERPRCTSYAKRWDEPLYQEYYGKR